MKILLGDFNAKVRRQNISNRHLGLRCYIGILMIMVLEYQLCQIKSLIVKSTMFLHRNIHKYLNCVVSIPFCTLIKFYYPSRLHSTYSNSCKLLQLVYYATCFGLSAIIRLTHKYDLITSTVNDIVEQSQPKTNTVTF